MSFDQALNRIPESLHNSVIKHWQQYLANAEREQVAVPNDQEIMAQLMKVWTTSEFVAKACCRDPKLLDDLITSGDLQSEYSCSNFHNQLHERLVDVDNEADLSRQLRLFRNREIVRIAWRDLAGLNVLSETLSDLSNLADACTDGALNKLYNWQCQRFGQPVDSKGTPQQLVVLGMGKLGGKELNFSSDIDLIFAFPNKGETTGEGKRKISNEEFFRRLGQSLIKALNEINEYGFVFRVDMRLRPFGESGPLVMSFTAFEDYYQTHGREWERYAMIKARVIAGNKVAGEQLLEELRPFVYRRYLDFGAFESLRNMKAMIAKEVARKGLQRNIKLGPGGIREIEFVGQAFQLIYGGREPELRQRSILAVLDYLAESNRLPEQSVIRVKAAYEFLRLSENRLQAWADQQTHNLPTDELAKQRLAYSMGFEAWRDYVAALMTHVEYVREEFRKIFAAPQAENDEQQAIDFNSVWNATVNEQACITYLGEQGFNEPEQALQVLRRLQESFTYRASSDQGRNRIQQLLPLLLTAISETQQPNATLLRITELLQTIARRSVYLSLLIENPVALKQLVTLCAASPWITQYLSRYPLLLDDLLDPRALYKPLEGTLLGEELEQILSRVPDNDEEQRLDALRHFKQSNVLRVAAADISGVMPLMIVSDYLTEIAEVLLRKILQLAWQDLLLRFGRPRCVIDEQPFEPGFAIIAYGKLGGLELNYGSDLDLVFLHDSAGSKQYTDGAKEIDNAAFFAKLGQRVIHCLSAHTPAGVLYEVDTRLRPSGRSGLLVSSFDAFAEYQRTQAWTWEHQAIARARMVAGSERVSQQFKVLRKEILCLGRDRDTLREEVSHMRERMRTELGSKEENQFDLKQDRGGIADIEFIVQYLILAHAHEHPALTMYSDNMRQIAGLEYTGILSSEDAASLRDAYKILRRYTHQATLREESPDLSTDQALQPYRHSISTLWQKLFN